MVEECGATVELCWWNSGTVTLKSGKVLVAQCGATVEKWNRNSGAGWRISGTVLVEQWNGDGGTV